MDTTLQTQPTTVPDSILAHFLAEAPDNAARIYRAAELVSHVERSTFPGLWLVRSASTPNGSYRVANGCCNCPDAARVGAMNCKHALAVKMFQALERAEVDAEQAQRPRCPVCGRSADRGCIDAEGNRLCTCDDHGDWEVPAIRVDPEDSILDLWTGEPCALPAQCPRCHQEPAILDHIDHLGAGCLSRELFGEAL